MEDLDAVFEPSVQTENEDDNSKLPETELPQPPESNPTGHSAEAWKSGLCACCNNPCNALVTVFCPCVTFGQVAEMVDEGNIKCCTSAMVYMVLCLFCFCGACKLSSTYRGKLRRKFNIHESPALDWVTHFGCECCALCQEFRELQSRGFNPCLGWKRNENKQLSMRPPTTQRMTN
ncbi:hypothetical protein Patl1_19116 [Pistacia atlantica]|uniref:Uncharacterized protein n=1 Tax=Pistacia atlantica TaxID=434234 RepID=A0ACC1C0C8_9ROSI|nr:hypothetical protein Patl1_19116 [Pistacia atlantica]